MCKINYLLSIFFLHVANVNFNPLRSLYTVTANHSVKCINLTITPDGILSMDIRMFSLSLNVQHPIPHLLVDKRSLNIAIKDSDSKYCIFAAY